MNRRQTCVFVSLLTAALLLGGCSDQNAPVDQVHPDDWILTHGGEADDDFAGCASCHGSDFKGGTVGVSCFECHLDGPPFQIHPSSWGPTIASHQTFPGNPFPEDDPAQTFNWTACATSACHGKDLMGGRGSGETGPSCFRDRTQGCHSTADGSPPAPHAENYFDPNLHGPVAKNDQLYCQNCHGREPNLFNGGFISDPDILNNPAGDCTLCHPAATAHPTNWQGSNDDESSNAYFSTHRTVASEAIGESCAVCHKTNGPGSGPFPGAPSCFSAEFTNANGITSGCHPNGPGSAPHPLDAGWLLPSGTPEGSHVLASIEDAGPCLACHVDSGIEPACKACHTATDPNFALGTCDSCHNDPPDGLAPAGNTRPNREGGHGGHDALTASTGDCSACHTGAGTDETTHYDEAEPADVAVLNTYDGNRGAAGYSSGTGRCTNISCHGGQQTPAWPDGALDVTAACTACHELGTAAGTPEDNSYFSGRHSSHAEPGGWAALLGFDPPCSGCHDPARLATDHFAGLDTPGLNDPAATLLTGLGYDDSVSPPTCTTNIAGCHSGQTRSWAAGAGGAPHTTGATWLLPSEHATAAINNSPACLSVGCHTLTAAGGGVSPACEACHTATDPNFALGTCDSCHNDPPDGLAPAGNAFPNRNGQHDEHTDASCSACHDTFGTGTLNHYLPEPVAAPANVNLAFSDPSDDLTYVGGRCNGVCHINGESKEHENFNWF